MFKLSMPSMRVGTSSVLFDVSRLLRSRNRTFATGVDRIDLAIGLNLLEDFGRRCLFVHSGPLGTAILPYDIGAALLAHLDARWNGGSRTRLPHSVTLRLLAKLALALVFPIGRQIIGRDTTYVVASHSGLGKKRGALRKLDPQRLMRRILYVHDIIPLEMPEYQRPQTMMMFKNYLGELTNSPITIASNSMDTDSRVRNLAIKEGWQVESFLVLKPSLVPLRERTAVPRAEISNYIADPRPFFAIIGTIEPRKNHLLLLNLWRQFSLNGGVVPRLCIIGKRGWENENILDMLDRCEPIQDAVTEFSDLTDHEVQMLMQGSKALLFPSFIEGLGIPLLEAEALNVPCIVSDIPVFREVAPPGTIFIDPLDGPGWKRAIFSAISDHQLGAKV